jgi:hypothetical protein
MVRCDASYCVLAEPFSLTIACVDPDIARKSGCENNSQLFACHWPWDDGAILPVVIFIIDRNIVSIVHAAISGLPEGCCNIRDLCGCLEKPNGNRVLYVCNITPIFDNNTAARWIMAAMKFSNPKHCRVSYHSQQADGTDGAQMPMHGCRTDLPVVVILPLPVQDMIDPIREYSEEDGDTRPPNSRSLPTTKTGFH